KAQSTGQPLALFAAAEIARDRLDAPLLARKLFLAYADLVPDAVWTPKALLAAFALSGEDSARATLRARLERYPGSAYVRHSNVFSDSTLQKASADGDVYTQSEERLDRSLIELVHTANTEADQRDATVVHTVAVIDSMRAVARADSL